jgi:hypothetical protein
MLVEVKTNGNFKETVVGAVVALQGIKGENAWVAKSIISRIGSLEKKGKLKISTADAMSDCLNLRHLVSWENQKGHIKEIIDLLEEIGESDRVKRLFKNQEDLFNFIKDFFHDEEEQPYDFVGLIDDYRVSIRWRDSKEWGNSEFLVSPIDLEVIELEEPEKEIRTEAAKKFEEKLKSFHKDRNLIKA